MELAPRVRRRQVGAVVTGKVGPCVIPGCERVEPNAGRHMCNRHYARFWKHGDALYDTRDPERLLWSKIDKVSSSNGCWLWTGALSSGYGSLSRPGSGTKRAHRVVYELTVGRIPAGQVLDHECHNRDVTCAGGSACQHRRCCNPAHLTPKTSLANVAASHCSPVNRAECPAGHPYDEANTYRFPSTGGRRCRACHREQERTRRAATGGHWAESVVFGEVGR